MGREAGSKFDTTRRSSGRAFASWAGDLALAVRKSHAQDGNAKGEKCLLRGGPDACSTAWPLGLLNSLGTVPKERTRSKLMLPTEERAVWGGCQKRARGRGQLTHITAVSIERECLWLSEVRERRLQLPLIQ